MLTKHFVTNDRLVDHNAVLFHVFDMVRRLSHVGIKAHRMKVEFEHKHHLTVQHGEQKITDFMYYEMHAKCKLSRANHSRLKQIAEQLQWRLSTNLRAIIDDENVVQFVNKRFYTQDVDLDEQVAELRHALDSVCDHIVMKHEIVIFDDNHGHDSWWA